MRYPIIDGFRGFFLLFMMIVHTNVEVHAIIGKLNHHYFGWVEDAQGFVFISGVVVGLVYGGIILRKSTGAMTRAIFRRIWTIYCHHAALVLAFVAVALLLSLSGMATPGLDAYAGQPVTFTAAALGLITASKHMGILPMYIYFMAVTPLILWAFSRGHARSVLGLSLLVWLLAQTGLDDAANLWATEVLARAGVDVTIGIFFNIFGWQIIFVAGLYLGFSFRTGDLKLDWLTTPAAARWAACAALLFVGFGVFDRVVYWDLISPAFSDDVLAFAVRNDFSIVHFLNFWVDLYLITWLVVAGPACGQPAIARLGRAISWVFTRPALVYLGKHSLFLFTYHILFIYALMLVLDGTVPHEAAATAIILAGVASLYLMVGLKERGQPKAPVTQAPPVAAPQA